jgi:hypothetical protein
LILFVNKIPFDDEIKKIIRSRRSSSALHGMIVVVGNNAIVASSFSFVVGNNALVYFSFPSCGLVQGRCSHV